MLQVDWKHRFEGKGMGIYKAPGWGLGFIEILVKLWRVCAACMFYVRL